MATTQVQCEYCDHYGDYPSEVAMNSREKMACLDTDACDRRDEAAHPDEDDE